jgi:hypothetical protein
MYLLFWSGVFFTLKYVKVIFLIFDINRLKLLKTLKKYQFQT